VEGIGKMSAEKLQWFRIKRAEELKDSVGEVYLEVMLRCLKGLSSDRLDKRTLDNVSKRKFASD
jgi:hypothetical protein